jgi:hypothetical protein
MEISLRSTISFNTENLLPDVLLYSEDLLQNYAVSFYQLEGGEFVAKTHWNEQHKASLDKEVKWDKFHFQEMCRLILSYLEPQQQRSELIVQRFQILHPLLIRRWCQSSAFDGEEEKNDIHGIYEETPGVSRNGQHWQRDTEPRYLSVNGIPEWVIVWDGRTMREILEGGISNEDVRVYASGLRLIQRSAVETNDITELSDYLLNGQPKINSKQFLQYWYENSAVVDIDRNTLLEYRPVMEVVGEWAYKHPVSTIRPLWREICQLTGGLHNIPLEINGDIVRLHFSFVMDDDSEVERLQSIFFVNHHDVRELSPGAMGLRFLNQDGTHVSHSKRSSLMKQMLYILFRDVTRHIRILVKESSIEQVKINSLGRLGIPKEHFVWINLTRQTFLEQPMKKLVLQHNGWFPE